MKTITSIALITAGSLTAAFAQTTTSFVAPVVYDTTGLPGSVADFDSSFTFSPVPSPSTLLEAGPDRQVYTLDLFFAGGDAGFKFTDLFLRFDGVTSVLETTLPTGPAPGIPGTIVDPAPFFENLDGQSPFTDPAVGEGIQWTFDLGSEDPLDSVFFDIVLDSRDNNQNGQQSVGLFSTFFPDANDDTPPFKAEFSSTPFTTGGKDFTIVRLEDKSTEDGGDNDINDIFLAFSISDGEPAGAVPEPSTYGLIGALILGALVAKRRLLARKA